MAKNKGDKITTKKNNCKELKNNYKCLKLRKDWYQN